MNASHLGWAGGAPPSVGACARTTPRRMSAESIMYRQLPHSVNAAKHRCGRTSTAAAAASFSVTNVRDHQARHDGKREVFAADFAGKPAHPVKARSTTPDN